MRVLFFLARWSNGGIEKNICNYLDMLHNSNVKTYIAALVKDGDLFDETLQKYNVNIMTCEERPRSFMGNRKKAGFLKKACEKFHPDIVHINISCGVAFMYSHVVNKSFPNIKVLVHGHSTSTEPPFVMLKSVYYAYYRILWEKTTDYCVACSKETGQYLFSKQRRKTDLYRVLHCAIDTKRYRFSNEEREVNRDKLRIPNEELVVGTVGRFEKQKNPLFIVDIIYALSKKYKEFKFLWIGEGEMKELVEEKVKKLQLDDKVVFISKSNNISGMLSVMDIFILPSLYEGLSIVNIEAQASGLYNLVSETVTDEAKICEKFLQLPIDNCNIWADKIIDIVHSGDYLERNYPEKEILKAKFDIEHNTQELMEIYSRM